MGWLSIAVTANLLTICLGYGDDWWQQYEKAKEQYSELEVNKEYPDKIRPAGFKHPPFQCPDMSPSPTVPTSVESVKAADIKAVAALGDSLTTGIAINSSTIVGIPIEYRDLVYSIGGYGTYEDVITLANILRLFNPGILGPAPKTTLHGYPTTLNDTGLNLAVTGHNTLNLSEQARNLIDTFKIYPGLNFTEDWKLVTILIGMNDICDHCKNKTLFSVDNFIHYMTESLDMFMNEVPRLIVNVVQILQMEALREVTKPSLACMLQKSFCSCLVRPADNSSELKELVELNLEFQMRLEQLLHSDRYFKHDFAVVLQPYLTKAKPARLSNGNIDISFFTPDCFHFTIKGHEELAKGLWNNMFQPAGQKFMIDSFGDSVKLQCPPVDHPYIYTKPMVASTTTSPGSAASATATSPGSAESSTAPSPGSAASSLPGLFLSLLALAYLH